MYSQIAANKRKTVLLIAVFLIIIWALGYFFGWYFDLGYTPLIMAFGLSIIMSLFGYYRGDSLALTLAGAQPITKEQNAYVYRLVENLCITAGLPTPKIYLINDSALNAFATGRDPEHASIALTTGIVKALANEELEGVIAHELSHVKNLDIRVMTIVIVCVGIVTLLTDIMLRGHFWGGGRRSDSRQAGAILMIIGLVLAILAPLFARLIQFAVSRQREFLADASSALLTRYPEGLARALEKISVNPAVSHYNRALSHLYISEPKPLGSRLTSLFSTHPPIAERVQRLRQMERSA